MKNKVENISHHRAFKRNYKPAELLGEIKNLINSGKFEDFIFVAAKGERRSVRIGSFDSDLRAGDLLLLNQIVKDDIMGY